MGGSKLTERLKWHHLSTLVRSNLAFTIAAPRRIGTLCTSLISHVIDLHLLEMKSEGFLDRAWEAHLQRTSDQKCINRLDNDGAIEDETYSLSIEEMAGIFIVHAILTAVAVAVALVGFYTMKKRKKNAGQVAGGSSHDIESSPSLSSAQDADRSLSLTKYE